MHQDAHEFLNYLLNRIVEEIQEEKRHQLTSAEDCTLDDLWTLQYCCVDMSDSVSISQLFLRCLSEYNSW